MFTWMVIKRNERMYQEFKILHELNPQLDNEFPGIGWLVVVTVPLDLLLLALLAWLAFGGA